MDWENRLIRKPSGREEDRLTLHERNGVVWFSFPILDRFDFVRSAFSTRIGGVSEGYVSSMNLSLSREISGGLGGNGLRTDLSERSAWENGQASPAAAMERFRENHRRFADAVGYDMENAVFSDQTHTVRIREVTREDRGNGITRPNAFHDVDGLMTDQRHVVMMTFYADCVPLLIVDPVKKAAACVHSGWRGTVAGIGRRAVERMSERYGSRPEDLVAAIGPCICGDCYEVSTEVADRFRQAYGAGAAERIVRPKRPGHAMLDLPEACRENFRRAGIPDSHISAPDICTAENPELLFSHRASGGKRGNLAAVLELR